MEATDAELRSLECSVISSLRVLYFSTQTADVRAGSLKILLHVLEVIWHYWRWITSNCLCYLLMRMWLFLELLLTVGWIFLFQRHGERLYYSWSNILEMLRFSMRICYFYPFFYESVPLVDLIFISAFRSVVDATEKDLVTLGFQVCTIMNET